jgi:hypothetical protein
MITIGTTCFKLKKSLYCPHCVDVFHTILRTKRMATTCLYSRDAVCFVLGGNCIFNYYLVEIRASVLIKD